MSTLKVPLGAGRPRSRSISDVKRTDAIVAADASQDVTTQDLSGVLLHRTGGVETATDGKTILPTYEYNLDNQRGQDVRAIISFSGSNLKVNPCPGFSVTHPLTVEGVLGSGLKAPFVTLSAADHMNDFAFDAEVKVFPAGRESREAELQGIFLVTHQTFVGTLMTLELEARSTRDHDVEVEVEVHGNLRSKTSPFVVKETLPAGKTLSLGSVETNEDVETQWKWTAVGGKDDDNNEPVIETLELKGVTLKQILTPGDPTNVDFEVVNDREANIEVTVDLEGEGAIDFKSHERPLKAVVLAKKSAAVGSVTIKGDVSVNWGYKEID